MATTKLIYCTVVFCLSLIAGIVFAADVFNPPAELRNYNLPRRIAHQAGYIAHQRTPYTLPRVPDVGLDVFRDGLQQYSITMPHGGIIDELSIDLQEKIINLLNDEKKLIPGKTLPYKFVYSNIAWSPNGKCLLVCDCLGKQNNVKFLTENGTPSKNHSYQATIESMSWSLDSKYAAVAFSDDTIRIFTIEGDFSKVLYDTKVACVKWLKNYGIVSGSSNGTIKLWDREWNLVRIINHGSPITCVGENPHNGLITSGASNGTIKLWSINGSLLHTLQVHDVDYNDRLIFKWSSTGNYLASKYRQVIKIYRFTQDGRPTHTFQLPTKANGFEWHPNGQILATTSLLGFIELWDNSGNTIKKFKFDPDAPSYENDMGQRVYHILNRVDNIEWEPKGKYLVTANAYGVIKIWDCDGNCQQVLEHTGPNGGGIWIAALAWKSDRQILVSSGGDLYGLKFFVTQRQQLIIDATEKSQIRDLIIKKRAAIKAQQKAEAEAALWKKNHSILAWFQENKLLTGAFGTAAISAALFGGWWLWKSYNKQ